VSGDRPTISACVVCRNDERWIEDCLRSVAWADEIVVMDLSSSDRTAELAAAQATQLLHHPWVPVVEAVRNEVGAAASGDWILVLDPDERVSPELGEELRRASEHDDIDAVVVPRMNYDLGFPPSDPLHRYEPQLRMYRRGIVEWPSVPNALPQVPPARVHRVPARDELVLVHDRNRTVPEAIERALRYAPAQAQAMLAAGETFSARRMLRDLGARAYTQFVRGHAYRDGVPGVLRAGLLLAFYFYVWACFWQLSGAGRRPEDDRTVNRVALPLRAFDRVAALRWWR